MKDTKLYEEILGLEGPWHVKSVELKAKEKVIEIEVECEEVLWACPKCGGRMHRHGSERRRWRHLDTCEFKTIVVCDVPRVFCKEDGAQVVQVPWAEKGSRFTRKFERFAIDVLLECSVKAASQLLRISWDEADGIKERAVRRGLRSKEPRPVKRLCVDEKSAGPRHDYVTLVVRVDDDGSSAVEYIGDGRTEESLNGYWESLSDEHLEGIEAVAMDMWKAYMNSTLLHLPGARDKIVHDRFHVMQDMNEAVNTVRKQEHRKLLREGDDTLRGSRQLWLFGRENVPEKSIERFDQLRDTTLKTARAWAIKEMLRDFWFCNDMTDGKDFFQLWYRWAARCRLPAVVAVARTLRRHLHNLLTYFKHRLTTAAAEGMNGKIQALIKKAYGYRSRERFKNDIFFHCGGLDLYPAEA